MRMLRLMRRNVCKAVGAVFAVLLLASTVVLTGCERQEQSKMQLVVILGNHANAPCPKIELLEDVILDCCLSYGKITLICDDGEPYSVSIPIPELERGYDDAYYMRKAKNQREEIMDAARRMLAKTPEVSTVKALQLAQRELSASESNAKKRLIILDSCLSTCMPLDFTKCNMAAISAEEIVQQLRELEELPLIPEDTDIVVYGCGDTSGSQTRLSGKARNRLIEVMGEILKAGGADVEMRSESPLSKNYDPSVLPTVSVVPVLSMGVELDSSETDDSLNDGAVISFDDSVISFEPGTAELVDEKKAYEALESIIEYLCNNKDARILIAGATAHWGTEEYVMDLSLKRANRICELITQGSGISEDRFETRGVGWFYNPFYTNDQTPEGELDGDIAPKNRTVNFVLCGTPTAEEILACAAQHG